MSTEVQLDVLAVFSHPDDAELTMAGTLLKLKALGYATVQAPAPAASKGGPQALLRAMPADPMAPEAEEEWPEPRAADR